MAYRIEKESKEVEAIVWDGWENGIAPSPHKGIGNIQCANISTETGEVMANYARTMKTQSAITGGTINPAASTTLSYTDSPTLIDGGWIHVTASTITNLAVGYYYVFNHSGFSFQVASTYGGSAIGSLGATGTATFDTVQMGKPVHYATELTGSLNNYVYFVLDASGNIWAAFGYSNTPNTFNWQLLNNPNTQSLGTNNNGLAWYRGYVFGFCDKKIRYFATSGISSAFPGWTTFSTSLNTDSPLAFTHTAITPKSKDTIAWCDGSYIGTLGQVPGQVFDPATTATYTLQLQALLLPAFETATCLGEVNNQLLVGAASATLYVWDYLAIGASFIYTAESYCQKIVTVNNMAYFFSGSKGNIYITNGSTASLVITIPDYVAASPTGSQVEPYFVWGGGMYLRGRVWFSVQATNCGGVWSFIPTQNFYIQQDTGLALRLEAQNSYGNYNGIATLLFAPQDSTGQNANGPQYWSAWDSGSSTYGIDVSSSTPYTGGQTIIETDAAPTGTMLNKKTFNQLEYKLSTALVTGEAVQLKYRTDLTAPFISAGTVQLDSAGSSPNSVVSGIFPANFQKSQWLQLQAVLTSTASNPSFCRVVDLRAR